MWVISHELKSNLQINIFATGQCVQHLFSWRKMAGCENVSSIKGTPKTPYIAAVQRHSKEKVRSFSPVDMGSRLPNLTTRSPRGRATGCYGPPAASPPDHTGSLPPARRARLQHSTYTWTHVGSGMNNSQKSQNKWNIKRTTGYLQVRIHQSAKGEE